MPFTISKKSSAEVANILGPNTLELADMLEAVQDQHTEYKNAVDAGSTDPVDLSQMNKFGSIIEKLDNRLKRLDSLQIEQAQGRNCLEMSKLTSKEIKEFSSQIDIALKNTADPKEVLFLETLKEILDSYKDAAIAKNITTRQIPLLPEEEQFLRKLVQDSNIEITLPRELKLQWVKEDIASNKNTNNEEKELLNYLYTVLEKESSTYPDKEEFSQVAEQHMQVILNQTIVSRLSQGWMGAVNSICQAFGAKPFYTELAQKNTEAMKESFKSIKSHLMNLKNESAEMKPLDPENSIAQENFIDQEVDSSPSKSMGG